MQRFSLYGVHKRDYQESVTIGQTDARTHTQTDAGQSDPYVPLCFAGDTKMKLDLFYVKTNSCNKCQVNISNDDWEKFQKTDTDWTDGRTDWHTDRQSD